MSRHFYTDPLAAAWMAKHFGMKFNHPESDKFAPIGTSDAIDAFINGQQEDGRFMVHPDSLHLLEPKAGDLVDFGWIHLCGQSFHELSQLKTSFEQFCEESTCDYDSHRIIQRNGKAFHWPESGAA